MRIGFTGTQAGMTKEQKERLESWIRMSRPWQFHHGDYIGADKEAHDIIMKFNNYTVAGVSIIIHPPADPKKRAFCKRHSCDKTEITELLPKPYMTRNHDIVDCSSVLVACPGQFSEVLRSGTWATMRYARKVGKIVMVIWPDGKIDRWC